MVKAQVELRDGRIITLNARTFTGLAKKLEKLDGIKAFTARTVEIGQLRQGREERISGE